MKTLPSPVLSHDWFLRAGRNYGKSELKRKQLEYKMTLQDPSIVSPLPAPKFVSKKKAKRLVRYAAKIKEQMERFEKSPHLQRTVALYKAACHYECAVKPDVFEENYMKSEPRYLPRPTKLKADGTPKPDAFRLIAFERVPILNKKGEPRKRPPEAREKWERRHGPVVEKE